MGSGAARSYSGVFVGTGADQEIDKVGFRPSSIILWNKTDPALMYWNDKMPADEAGLHTDATSSHLTTNGITATDTGFELGANATFNADGDQIFFTAWE
jgi:hypothetical protein